jgi:hypothetical protein
MDRWLDTMMTQVTAMVEKGIEFVEKNRKY